MREVKQSSAANGMVFMADSTDHVTGKTGLTLTITASKDGAAFGSITPTVTERGNGWYNLALISSHTDTLGDLVVRATGTGADASERVLNVVANVEADTKAVADTILTESQSHPTLAEIEAATVLAIAALQADLGDPSADATTIYAKIQALQAAVVAIPVVNILSATKGAIQVSYAKTGGTVEVVKGDTISIPYGPLGKDITGRKVYFGVKQLLSDTVYAIAVKEITAQITNAATFTGTIPLTSAELNLPAGNYYAEIESRGSDGTSTPATEMKFILKVVDQVITPAA